VGCAILAKYITKKPAHARDPNFFLGRGQLIIDVLKGKGLFRRDGGGDHPSRSPLGGQSVLYRPTDVDSPPAPVSHYYVRDAKAHALRGCMWGDL
jgi:hypothetical protein